MAENANPYSTPSMPSSLGYQLSGYRLVEDTQIIQPQKVDFGQVFNVAFEIWKKHIGLLALVVVIQSAISGIFWVAGNGIEMFMNEQDLEGLGIFLSIITSLVDSILGIYLGIGLIQICLRLARGENAEVSDLFGGGSVLLPAILVSIPVAIALGIGFLALIIPGIILSLVIWPYYYFIVDQKTTPFGSINAAITITSPNIATGIMMAISSVALGILGFLALGIGLFFTTGLVAMIYSVGYLMMSGQLIPSDKLAK